MRAKEFTTESAVDELKEKLPSLKKIDYDSIDELMQRISHKYKITGQKLHDMFVKKYKHTPDFWIKKYKEKLKEEVETTFVVYLDEKPVVKFRTQSEAIQTVADLKKKYPGKKVVLKPVTTGKTMYEAESSPTLILYINDRPIAKYTNKYDAERDIQHLQRKFPDKKYELKQEICKLTDVQLEENQKQMLGEIIRKVGNQYRLYSKKGKNLGTFSSKAGAEKHEREVQYFKHVKEGSEILKVNENEIMDEFVSWTKKILGIKSDPKITWSHSTEEAQQGHHTGRHTDGSNEIWVYVKNRNLVDIMRTVFHEFVHVRQGEQGKIKPDSSYPGSPIERQADELAGKYIKIFGAKHPEIFQ